MVRLRSLLHNLYTFLVGLFYVTLVAMSALGVSFGVYGLMELTGLRLAVLLLIIFGGVVAVFAIWAVGDFVLFNRARRQGKV